MIRVAGPFRHCGTRAPRICWVVPRTTLPLIALVLTVTVPFAADVRPGYYRGRHVQFVNRGGLAIIDGDIIAGPAEELEHAAGTQTAAVKPDAAVVASGTQLWPGGVIPYTLDPKFQPDQQQSILAAISQWNMNTPIQLQPRASQENYVEFVVGGAGSVCSSAVGMTGGAQEIVLPASCATGDIIHEIGHTAGLGHETERSDRNRYVTIRYENIDRESITNFDEAAAGEQNLGPYDFNSIMHYGAYDYSVDGVSPSIETVPAGIPIGQRVSLSAGDIAAVQQLYGAPSGLVTIATTPSGLQAMVDGAIVSDGTSFAWAAGSRHRVEALEVQGNGPIRYIYGSWSDGGPKAHEFIVSAAMPAMTANYVRQRLLTPSVSPANAGSVSVYPESADGYYTERSRIQLTAQPAAGYNFLDWSLTPSTGANPKFLIANQPLAIAAYFTASPVTTIASTPIGMTVDVDGLPVSTPRNFAWGAGETHVLSPAATALEDSVRYTLTDWGDGNGPARTIATTQGSSTFTAAFTVQYKLLVSSNVPVEVTPSSIDGFYERGAALHLSASTAADMLVSWSGDLSGSVNPAAVMMNSEKLIWGLALSGDATSLTVVNGASLQQTSIAPGEMVTLYAPGANASMIVTPLDAPTKDAGNVVSFDGVPAEIVYSSATQITAIVPGEAGARTSSQIVAQWGSGPVMQAIVPVAVTSPGLFTADGSGVGHVVAFNEDGTANSPQNPAQRGSGVTLYVTGIGARTSQITVRIDGQPVTVSLWSMARQPVAGVVPIHFQVPAGVMPGSDVAVYVGAGDQTSPADAQIAIQ